MKLKVVHEKFENTKGLWKAVIWGRTDNAMAKGKGTYNNNKQTMVDKIKYKANDWTSRTTKNLYNVEESIFKQHH